MTGAEIRKVRQRLGLTQGQFGALFGVKEPSVSRWETGSHTPTAHQTDILLRLKRASGVPLPALDRLLKKSGAIIVLSLLLSRALKADGLET